MRRLTLISAAVLVAIIPGVVVAAPGDLISELMPPNASQGTLCGLRVSGLGQNSSWSPARPLATVSPRSTCTTD